MRAVCVGSLIGGVVCVGNIYFGLKAGMSLGSSFTGAILGFAALSPFPYVPSPRCLPSPAPTHQPCCHLLKVVGRLGSLPLVGGGVFAWMHVIVAGCCVLSFAAFPFLLFCISPRSRSFNPKENCVLASACNAAGGFAAGYVTAIPALMWYAQSPLHLRVPRACASTGKALSANCCSSAPLQSPRALKPLQATRQVSATPLRVVLRDSDLIPDTS